ncbi:MAG: DUF2207 domain-containing protein [Campylobacterota bacterium]|nr:DUF2207 domain-containing protein [Campylobacterota bacterium]
MLRIISIYLLLVTLSMAESIAHYSVKLNLETSGQMSVREDIEYDFGNLKRHGILREIPTQSRYMGQIIDIGLHQYSVSMDGRYVKWSKSYPNSYSQGKMVQLKIGDPYRKISNSHRYTINYRVNKTILPYSDGLDTLRWNLIGTGWKIPIKRGDFDIHLPSTLERNKITQINVFYGKYGSKKSFSLMGSNFIEWHSNRHFSFSLANFKRYEGVTVELVFAVGNLTQSGADVIKEASRTYNLGQEHIAQYDATLKLNPSGTIELKENIDYDFGSKKRRGIYRDIPSTIKYQGKGRPIDIGLSDFNVTMDGKGVNWIDEEWRSYATGQMKRIRIGSSDIYIKGQHKYAIGYRVNNIILPFDDSQDKLSWNLIGTKWRVGTQKANINVHLPSSLDKKSVKIKVYRGKYRSTTLAINQHDIKWHSPQHFSFSLYGLQKYEGVTLEVVFDQGILGHSGADTLKEPLWLELWRYFYIPIALLFLHSLYSRAKESGMRGFFGRSFPPYYYPPKGLSIMQASVVLNGASERKDIFPAILELAQKGYITIHNNEDDPYILKNKKIRETHLSYDQKAIMKALFKKDKDRYEFTSIVSSVESLRRSVVKKSSETFFTEESSSFKGKFLLNALFWFVALFSYGAYIAYIFYGEEVMALCIGWMVTMVIGVWWFFYSLQAKSWLGGILSFMWIVFFSGFIVAIMDELPSIDAIYMTPVPLVLIIIPALFFIHSRIHPLSDKGLETYTQLIGLKKFIEQVDKDRIKELLKKDPNYMDRVLPYATLFGLNDHWIELSDEILVDKNHDWYSGNMMAIALISTQLSAQTTPTYSSSGSSYSSSYSGGGGYSGGGSYSGGGGGGGGGGSW